MIDKKPKALPKPLVFFEPAKVIIPAKPQSTLTFKHEILASTIASASAGLVAATILSTCLAAGIAIPTLGLGLAIIPVLS